MKRIGLLTISILLTLISSATTRHFLDSMSRVLDTTTQTTVRLNCLYTLSFEYGLIDPPKGIVYGRQCLKEAIEAKDLLYELCGNNGIGNAYEILSQYDSAKYYHQQSYRVALRMKRPDKMALTLNNIASCDKELGNYQQALDNYLKSYKILERQGTYNYRVHVSIGEMYLRLGNTEQAEYHSRLGLQRCLEVHHDDITYILYTNLAKCMLRTGRVDSAIINLQIAIPGLLRRTDIYSVAMGYNTLGEAYETKGWFRKAYEFYDLAHIYYTRVNNTNGCIVSEMNALNAWLRSGGKWDAGMKARLTAVERLMQQQPNNDMLFEAYQKAADTYEILENPNRALVYYKRYYTLKDSLLNENRYQQILELQTRYETEKKEYEIVNLKQSDLIKSLEIRDRDQAIQKKNTLLIIGVLLLVSVLVAVYFRMQRQRLKMAFEKQMAIKATEETERIRMAKDIHDDLGSGLSKISFLSELILQNGKGPAATAENAEAIRETAKKLVVNMRDLIWALDPENTSLEGLVARIREYSNDYLEEFSIKLSFSENQQIPQQPISKESYRAILMVVKEALNNIVKHAKATAVEIQVKVENELFSVSIGDNGSGIPTPYKPGNGLQNMKTRIETIGGSFAVDTSDKGTTLLASFSIVNDSYFSGS